MSDQSQAAQLSPALPGAVEIEARVPHEGPLKRLYHWTMALAGKPYAAWALGFVAFAESSFFPFPPDIILIPMSLARPKRAWLYALICTVCSVAGALVGYALGALLFETLGKWVIDFYGYGPKMAALKHMFDEYGWLVIIGKGLTPIPFKLVTITSGLLRYNMGLFILCCTITRGARFIVTAVLLNRYGEAIKGLLERFFGAFLAIMTILVVAGAVVALKVF